MRRIVLYFFLLGILSAAPTQLASSESYQPQLNVLSTIKPVQAIVAAVAGDHIRSNLLIPAYTSPHDYTFKPSDIRKIQKADLIFRIDEHFESMFNTVFAGLPDDGPVVISLAENPEIKLLPAAGGHKHGSEDHDSVDMHIFTSPQNAISMAKEINNVLSKADAKHASAYQANLQIFIQAIRAEEALINSKLALLKDESFIVFHPSWQYFSDYFGLKKPAVVELHESVSTGVKSIMAIRQEIASKDVSCIFTEPTISPRRIHAITENLTVKVVEVDVMGQDVTMTSHSYIKWLEAMGEKINHCLEVKH